MSEESTFPVDILRTRLRKLNSSQNSIQTMSLWIAHHHASCVKIAKIWAQELSANTGAKPDWITAMFYVANDVVQTARKNQAPHMAKDFLPALKSGADFVGKNKSKWPEKVFNSINRVINILGERGIYNSKEIADLKAILNGEAPSSSRSGRHDATLEKYEHNIEDRMKIRSKAFSEALNSIKGLMNPPSADSETRRLIATYPEAIADPKNVNPTSLDAAQKLLERTTEAHSVVDTYAKKVKLERDQTKDLCKQLETVNNLLNVESRLDMELLQKARSCMDKLKKKQAMLAQQRERLPDEPKISSGLIMPEEIEEFL